ncbi:chromate efflux transporter [Hymenobacter jeollabukensis]|uniref:Chromate efflux transporter n=1 Tax=Hymenobacter jeollabukensis TaxID=2025313 RepID=A0A5R8WUY2_9BACT|nr:chromate efflux transporter [Hymenobacter jeollabukensis]TLM95235.1 chromate efflux transporter [Hymenobacter jeollabukensis]
MQPSDPADVKLAPPPRRLRTKRVRGIIFLKDVALLGCTAFGGPQAHTAMMFRLLVDKRRYLSSAELLELMALCQVLPGPGSTQTITAIGFRLGGPNLAYLTLLVWILPSVLLMTAAALSLNYLDKEQVARLVRYVQPVAVGFVAYSAYKIAEKVIHTKTSVALLVAAALVAYFFQLPWVLPLLLIGGGLVTTFRYRKMPQIKQKEPLRVEWANFLLWLGVFLLAALLGHYTRELPVRLFENFYRNGSLVFGGGQVLAPLLYAEFVEFKEYLSGPEFLSGYGLTQALPGPNFSIAAYIGALAMRDYGTSGQLIGALVGAVGIFMPGTLLIFFLIRFWDQLKQYRVVKASLEGINAVSAGLVVAATFLLYHPLPDGPTWHMPGRYGVDLPLNPILVGVTFLILLWDRLPSYVLVLSALLLGALLP